jgi:hypothetical protein
MVEIKGIVRIGQNTKNKDDYWVYDDNGFICGSLGCEREKLEKLIDKINNSIALKNIDLTGISELEQLYKVKEENVEFDEALINYLENRSVKNRLHVIEEFWDKVQSSLGMLDKYEISADEVMKLYHLHLEKIKERPRKEHKGND